jgi:hypothetical protein
MILPQAGPRGRRVVAVLAVLLGAYLGAYHIFRAHTGRLAAEHKQGLAIGIVLIVGGTLLWRFRRTD